MSHAQAHANYLADAESRYNPDLHLLGESKRGSGYHSTLPDGVIIHGTREALNYAVALLQRDAGDDRARAADIVRATLALQDTDPLSHTYGIWPYYYEESLEQMSPPDWNWADFCGARLVHLLVEHTEQLPPDLIADVRTSLGHAAWSIFRRNVRPGYTNIAIMGGGLTLAAGEVLDEPRLVDYGRQRLASIVEYVDYHGGFTEYNSPTYTLVAIHECERVLQLAQDPAARDSVETLRARLWETLADHYHPGTAQLAGPHSRAYTDRLTLQMVDYLSETTGVTIPPHPEAESRGSYDVVRPLPCPAHLIDRFRALPADAVEIRDTYLRGDDGLTLSGMTWLIPDATLGSINNHQMWIQRRPILGYWRTSADPAATLRVRFLHDGVDFASARVHTVQQGPRLLAAFGLLADHGDFHISLDKPAGGLFEAEDFRIRCELRAADATVTALDADRFALSAGDYRAIIHTAGGLFGTNVVRWETGGEDGYVYVDGICYSGPHGTFPLDTFTPTRLALALELLQATDDPSTAMLDWSASDDDTFRAEWANLTVSAPAGLVNIR